MSRTTAEISADILASGDNKLTDAEKDRCREIQVLIDGHPALCLDRIVVLMLDERVEGYPVADWLPEYLQDCLWSWMWWADYFGHSIEHYAKESDRAPWFMDALRASPPYPEGYKPETRR